MTHYLVTAIIDFIVCLVALSKTGNRAAKALSLTCFSLGLWSIELFLLTVVSDVNVLSTWFHITRWGMFFIPPSLALLTWMLIGARSKAFLNVIILPGFVISAILSFLNFFVFPSKLELSDGGYLPKVDWIFYVFALHFVISMLATLFIGFTSYRTATHREKQRSKWLLIIMSMSLLTGLASISLVTYDFYLKLVGASANIIFVCLLFYSTVQHHLMDFRLALSVGIARIMLITAVAWSYFFISSAVEGLRNSITGVLVMLIFIVVVLEAYPRLLRWLLPGAKKLIASDSYDFEKVTSEARIALNAAVSHKGVTRTLDFLLKHLARVRSYDVYVIKDGEYRCINSILRGPLSEEDQILFDYCTEHRGITIADETPGAIQTIMDSREAGALSPICFEGRNLGFVLIGASEEGAYYRYDDIRLFEWLCSELGSVVSRIYMLDEMQEQLGQAKKTLSMLGVMNHYHHDIKAPLAIIDGVLSNDIYDKEKQKDVVLQQVERGSRLIATMAGILKGERKRKVQPLYLSEVVKDSVFLFSQGQVQIEYEFSDIPKISGDAEDLKILVINIVKNAIEARREGVHLVITITTKSEGDSVILSIVDNGTGMPQSVVDALWDENLSSKKGGNGIGMQAVKRIADEHFMDIAVNSEEGVGTEFAFTFPSAVIVTDDDGGESPDDNSIFTKKDRFDKPLAG